MKNKTINLIGRTAILGLVMAIILMPSNAQAGVLMSDSFTSNQNDVSTQITLLINTWLGLDESEKLAPGVLMGD